MQNEGQVHDPRIHLLGLGGDQLPGKGQAGGDMDVGRADVQVG